MFLIQLKIFVISTILLAIFSMFDPIRHWVRRARQQPVFLILLVLLFIGLFLTPDQYVKGGVNEIDRYRFFRIIIIISISITVCILIAFKGFKLNKPGSTNYWMLAFSLFGMMSYFYSVNAMLTLWKGFEVFTVVVVFFYFSVRISNMEDVYDLINSFSLIILFLVISSLVGALIAPEVALIIQRGGLGGAHAYAYQGVFPSIPPNSLAQIGAMVGMIGLVNTLYKMESSRRILGVVLLCIGVLAMLMAHSRTSIIGFVVSAIFLFAFGQKKLIGFILVTIGSAVILVIPKFYHYAEQYIVRGQTKDAFVTLSGRMNFWPDVMEAFWLSPAVGHGYYAGHRDLVVDGRKLLQYSSVDNTYLEVLVDLGVLGLIVIIAAVISVGLKWFGARPSRVDVSIREKWKPHWILLTGFLLIVFIRSLTGPTFQVYHPNLMLFLLLGLCLHKATRISDKASKKNIKQGGK